MDVSYNGGTPKSSILSILSWDIPPKKIQLLGYPHNIDDLGTSPRPQGGRKMGFRYDIAHQNKNIWDTNNIILQYSIVYI